MIEGERNTPGMFTAGEPLSASKLNRVSDFASRSRTYINPGIKTTQGPFGSIYEADEFIQEQAYYDYPFKVSIAQGETPGSWKVYVRAGAVNSWIPKVLEGPDAGKYLDDTPTPHIPLTSASGNTKYVVLRCTASGGTKFFPNTTDVYLVDSLEALENSDDNGHLLLASLSLEKQGGTIISINSVNQYIYSAQSLIRVKPGSQPALWNWTSR